MMAATRTTRAASSIPATAGAPRTALPARFPLAGGVARPALPDRIADRARLPMGDQTISQATGVAREVAQIRGRVWEFMRGRVGWDREAKFQSRTRLGQPPATRAGPHNELR